MLTLICGIPNAGKTTYSQYYNNVIHLDDVMPTHKSHLDTVCNILQQEYGNICVEGVFLSKHSRKKILQAYQGIKKICIWLDTPLEICISRENRNRSVMIIKNCHMLFEPPTYDEGWDKIVRIYNEQSNDR